MTLLKFPHVLLPFLLLLLLSGCGSSKTSVSRRAEKSYTARYQAPRREVRAAWLPTVTHSDYMRMSTAQLQQHFVGILDQMQRMNFNVVIFQIRPEADAWYYSPYEPWSRYLTGTQGMPPSPMWDPMEFLIRECHKRHMEFHAWINPYRAATNVSNIMAPTHPYRRHPEWFIRYGSQWLFDPGLPEVRDYTVQIVRDIVSRYDIDALHMDDYFYPYPNPGERFDDQESFLRYGQVFGSLAEWRRDNVDQLIQALSSAIKQIKPYVRFGISPFGIYRNVKSDPNGSKTNGLQNYDDLYADILLWDKMGWVDYIMPQLYWEMGHKAADYTELAYWWARHIKRAHYVIGQSVRRTMDSGQLHPKLIISAETAVGNSMWPAEDVLQNHGGIAHELHQKYWKHPALLPSSPYPYDLKDFPEPSRDATLLRSGVSQELVWMADLPMPKGLETKFYVIYCHPRGKKLSDALSPENIVGITTDTRYTPLELEGQHKVAFTITRVDRFNHEKVIAHGIKAVL